MLVSFEVKFDAITLCKKSDFYNSRIWTDISSTSRWHSPNFRITDSRGRNTIEDIIPEVCINISA
jgi:hypothetical protein